MTPSRLGFRIDAQAGGSQARAAIFRTLHGEVETPLFMPVGTQAAVKAQSPETLLDSGTQILLANTYHLLLPPGARVGGPDAETQSALAVGHRRSRRCRPAIRELRWGG